MQVVDKKVGDVFSVLRGQPVIGDMLIPTGEYDPNDPEDEKLLTLVPEFDPGYRFPGRLIKPLIIALNRRNNVLLHGPTGVGKTMAAKMIAARCNLPITRLNLDGEIGRPEIVGYLGIPNPNDPDDDGYKMPALVRGIQRPGIVILDEWDAARSEVSIALQPLLEDHQPGLFLVERDTFVHKHKDCVVIATANTRGLGDATGLYSGTQSQSFAQLNRFHMVLEVEPLSDQNIDVILQAQLYDGQPLRKEVRETIVQLYSMVLSAFKAGQLTAPMSVRNVIHYADYFMLLGPYALKLVVTDKMATEQDRKAVEEMARRLKLVE